MSSLKMFDIFRGVRESNGGGFSICHIHTSKTPLGPVYQYIHTHSGVYKLAILTSTCSIHARCNVNIGQQLNLTYFPTGGGGGGAIADYIKEMPIFRN